MYLLDVCSYVLLDVVLLQSLRGALHGVLLHLLGHVRIFDHRLSVRHGCPGRPKHRISFTNRSLHGRKGSAKNPVHPIQIRIIAPPSERDETTLEEARLKPAFPLNVKLSILDQGLATASSFALVPVT